MAQGGTMAEHPKGTEADAWDTEQARIRQEIADIFGLPGDTGDAPGIEQIALVGWKQICEALGGINRKTAKKWADEHGLPVKYVDGTPIAIPEGLTEWVREKAE
jgi:hypothetical protein